MESESSATVHLSPKVKRDGDSEHMISPGLRGRMSTKLAQGSNNTDVAGQFLAFSARSVGRWPLSRGHHGMHRKLRFLHNQ